MSLSIVIPVLDEEAGIVNTLAALAPLRARGTELILVDGGSRDRTVALARPLCDCVVSSARGRATQMNAGAAIARGDILVFLHADTRLPDDADRLIEAEIDRGRRGWGRFDVRIEGRHWFLPVIATMMNLRSRLTGVATGDQAIFVIREAFAVIGGFPDQPLMEDIEISRRLKRLSRPNCLRARVSTSGRRWERHGVFKTILLMWRLRLRYFFGADPAELAKSYGHGPRGT
jgi:rSAM/selenodomain-associated transferase 2